ncbi:MAG: dihydroorotase [Actinomycetota bacterium]
MHRFLIKGGRVIDPANGIDQVMDILIENGAVSKLGEDLGANKGLEVIDTSGRIVTPGLIDIHVHLREPGREDEETIASGTRAAARGGFTSIACMPNTTPPIDNASLVETILERARKKGVVNVFPVAAITKGLKGKEISEMGDLIRAGAVAFSDDGESVANAEVMRRALEYARMFGVPLISHAEDKNLSDKGQMNEGYYSTLLGLRGIPAAAEEIAVARDLILAGMTGSRIHITHVSTRGSVQLVRDAKKRGIRVTCDVTPHHLVLSDESLISYDTNLKVNPPLRSREDVEALRKGLIDGTIDAIASDHAPHAPEEKEREFEYAAFGIVGLETSLPLMITELVRKKVLSFSQLIEKMSLQPARIIGIDKLGRGSLAEGSPADLTIINPEVQAEVDTSRFESRSRNTPFTGWKLYGWPEQVFVGGNLVYGQITKKARKEQVKVDD